MATPGEEQKEHWERVHETKSPLELSWSQEEPTLSLRLIEDAALDGNARILDMGGGVSRLVDELLDRGYEHVTVLDISRAALEHTRRRLGERAEHARFVVGDALKVALPPELDLWHDRAVFHFLTEPEQRQRYAQRLRQHLKPGGHAVIATFAQDGPERCSGLPTMRYSADALHEALGADAFERIAGEREVHVSPQGREQRFQYVLLRRR